MRYIFVLLVLVLACFGCNDCDRNTITVIDPCYDAVAFYEADAVSYCPLPAYWVIYAYGDVFHIRDSDLPETAFDVETCLTPDQLEELEMPLELFDPSTNKLIPELYCSWLYGQEVEDNNNGHGNDCDHDDDDNPGHHH
jgi:hypothetical protein